MDGKKIPTPKLEDSGLITEAMLSRQLISIWQELTPTCELYVRRINRELYVRDFPPIKTEVSPERIAFVNELAFEIVKSRYQSGERRPPRNVGVGELSDAAIKVEQELSRRRPEIDAQPVTDTDFELSEVRELVVRLWIMLPIIATTENLRFHPRFPGCGILGECEGDAVLGNQLVEVKSGDRGFRSILFKSFLRLSYSATGSSEYGSNLIDSLIRACA